MTPQLNELMAVTEWIKLELKKQQKLAGCELSAAVYGRRGAFLVALEKVCTSLNIPITVAWDDNLKPRHFRMTLEGSVDIDFSLPRWNKSSG